MAKTGEKRDSLKATRLAILSGGPDEMRVERLVRVLCVAKGGSVSSQVGTCGERGEQAIPADRGDDFKAVRARKKARIRPV